MFHLIYSCFLAHLVIITFRVQAAFVGIWSCALGYAMALVVASMSAWTMFGIPVGLKTTKTSR